MYWISLNNPPLLWLLGFPKVKGNIFCLNCTCIISFFWLGLQLKEMNVEWIIMSLLKSCLPVTDILKSMGIFTTFKCGSEWEYKSICNFVTCIPCLLSETEGYLRSLSCIMSMTNARILVWYFHVLVKICPSFNCVKSCIVVSCQTFKSSSGHLTVNLQRSVILHEVMSE